ncbi:AAA family ATPase [Dethiobacter alkaliphilus]|uniref:AAA family ATPase n=1 Tax=Dethiobacter alkaliphilus TaxID=427926 RepID=UPI002227E2B1|nr:AAA family ATPase [Dethiobacter alkaliphilus]MCW3489657.1 AAA family ATPase [Dethiobacter alkaliphilus]
MSITWLSVTLSGFGRYRDETTFRFAPGVNVYLAGNEAGKTTLAAGLAAIIYGLPATADPRAFGQGRYKNWDDPARFAGELNLQAGTQQYRILRNFANNRVSLQRLIDAKWQEEVGGEHKPGARKPNLAYEKKITELLGINSRELFMATFFVGQPLPQDENINPEIQQLISGSGAHYRDALDSLLAQAKAITRYTGRLGLTGQDMRNHRELELLEDEIATVGQSVRDSEETLLSLQNTSEELSTLRRNRQLQSEELQKKEEMLSGWQKWRNLRERYTDSLQRQNVLSLAVEQGKKLQGDIQEKKRRLNLIMPGDCQDADEMPDFATLGPTPLQTVEEAKEAAKRLHSDWQTFLADLEQLDLLESRLAGDYSLFEEAEPTLLEQLAAYNALRYRLETEKSKAAADFQRLRRLEEDCRATREDFDAEFADLADLPENAAELIDKKLQLLNKMRREKEIKRPTGKSWLPATAAAALMGGAAFWLSRVIWLSGAVAAATAFVVLYILAQIKRNRQASAGKKSLGELDACLQQVEAQLGQHAFADEAALGELRMRLKQRQRAAARVQEMAEALPPAHAREAVAVARESADNAYNSFLEQAKPFLRSFTDIETAYETWRDMLRKAAGLRESVASFVRRQGTEVEPGQLMTLSPAKLSYPWPVLASLAGVYDSRAHTAETLMSWLGQRDAAWWQKAINDAKKFAQTQQEATALLQEIQNCRQELSGLLAAHGAADLGQLQNVLTDATNRAVRILQDWEQVIEAHPGLPGTGEQDPHNLAEFFRNLEAETARLREEDTRLHETIRQLEIVQSRLQGKAPHNLAALQERQRDLTEKRGRLQREKAALKLAYTELSDAIQNFSSSYRQELAQKASEIFCRITGQRERKLELDENFNIGVTEEGRAVSPAQLSQGTRDQLYISLRLAIADLLAADVRLPFILDDPFLNWDENRLEIIGTTLAQIGQNRQVILLSHRQEYAHWGTHCQKS